MLGHRLRRWTNIIPALAARLVFLGPLSGTLHTEPSLPQGPIYIIIKQQHCENYPSLSARNDCTAFWISPDVITVGTSIIFPFVSDNCDR